MHIVALTHTEGVVLNNKYVILELAYRDIFGVHEHFLIQSPISYTNAKKNNKYLKKSLEVIMCTSNEYHGIKVHKFYDVLKFLKDRYKVLRYYYGYQTTYGYKGCSFQKDILVKCNIPNINIESFGIPKINTLKLYHPTIKRLCCYHKHYYNKCAEHILRLISAHLNNYYT